MAECVAHGGALCLMVVPSMHSPSGASWLFRQLLPTRLIDLKQTCSSRNSSGSHQGVPVTISHCECVCFNSNGCQRHGLHSAVMRTHLQTRTLTSASILWNFGFGRQAITAGNVQLLCHISASLRIPIRICSRQLLNSLLQQCYL